MERSQVAAAPHSEMLTLLLTEGPADSLGVQIEQLILRDVPYHGDSACDRARTLRELVRLSTASSKRVMCCYVFKRGDLAYNCRQCQSDETCVVCEECYRNSDHAGHDVSFQRINTDGTGCCDCGDTQAWKREGFCECHGPMSLSEKMAGLAPPLIENIRRGIATCVAFVVATARLSAVVGGFRGPTSDTSGHASSELSEVARRICENAGDWQVSIYDGDSVNADRDVVSIVSRLRIAGSLVELRSVQSDPQAVSIPPTTRVEDMSSAFDPADAAFGVEHADALRRTCPCASQHRLTHDMSCPTSKDPDFSLADFLVLPYASDPDAAKVELAAAGTVTAAVAPQRAAIALWNGLRRVTPATVTLAPGGQRQREERAIAVCVWLRSVCEISDGLCSLVADAFLPADAGEAAAEAADYAAPDCDGEQMAYLDAARSSPLICTLLEMDTLLSRPFRGETRAILMRLLGVKHFKGCFALSYARAIGATTTEMLRGGGFAKSSYTSLSVQFLNRATHVELVASPSRGPPMQETLLRCLLEEVTSKENTIARFIGIDPQSSAAKRLARLGAPLYELSRFSVTLADLRYCVIASRATALAICQGDSLGRCDLNVWLRILATVNGMYPMRRRAQHEGHVHHEDVTVRKGPTRRNARWAAAFQLTLDVHIFSSILLSKVIGAEQSEAAFRSVCETFLVEFGAWASARSVSSQLQNCRLPFSSSCGAESPTRAASPHAILLGSAYATCEALSELAPSLGLGLTFTAPLLAEWKRMNVQRLRTRAGSSSSAEPFGQFAEPFSLDESGVVVLNLPPPQSSGALVVDEQPIVRQFDPGNDAEAWIEHIVSTAVGGDAAALDGMFWKLATDTRGQAAAAAVPEERVNDDGEKEVAEPKNIPTASSTLKAPAAVGAAKPKSTLSAVGGMSINNPAMVQDFNVLTDMGKRAESAAESIASRIGDALHPFASADEPTMCSMESWRQRETYPCLAISAPPRRQTQWFCRVCGHRNLSNYLNIAMHPRRQRCTFCWSGGVAEITQRSCHPWGGLAPATDAADYPKAHFHSGVLPSTVNSGRARFNEVCVCYDGGPTEQNSAVHFRGTGNPVTNEARGAPIDELPVSLHYPLHRFAATLIRKVVCAEIGDESSSGGGARSLRSHPWLQPLHDAVAADDSSTLVLQLVEYPIRCAAFTAQCRVGMYVRNGLAASNMELNYSSTSWLGRCTRGNDMTLLQWAAVMLSSPFGAPGPRTFGGCHLVALLLRHYRLVEWWEGVDGGWWCASHGGFSKRCFHCEFRPEFLAERVKTAIPGRSGGRVAPEPVASETSQRFTVIGGEAVVRPIASSSSTTSRAGGVVASRRKKKRRHFGPMELRPAGEVSAASAPSSSATVASGIASGDRGAGATSGGGSGGAAKSPDAVVGVPEAPTVEQERQKDLSLELLELIIVLITELPAQFTGTKESSCVPNVVRRELLHLLAQGSSSFGALAEKAQTVCHYYKRGLEIASSDLTACVSELAMKRESYASGFSTPSLVLRPEMWLEFDPCFMYLARNQRESARERWLDARGRLPEELQMRAPIPIAPRPPACVATFREAREAIAWSPAVHGLIRSTLTDALVAAIDADTGARPAETAAALLATLGNAYGTALAEQCKLRAERSSNAHICHALHLLTLAFYVADDADDENAQATLCDQLARSSPGSPPIFSLLARLACVREYGGVSSLDFVLAGASGGAAVPKGVVASGIAWILSRARDSPSCLSLLRNVRESVSDEDGAAAANDDGAKRENAQANVLASMKQAQAAFMMNFADMSLSSDEEDDESGSESETNESDEGSAAAASAAPTAAAAAVRKHVGGTSAGGTVSDAARAGDRAPTVCVMCHEDVAFGELGTSSMGRFAHVQRSTLCCHSERRYSATLQRLRTEDPNRLLPRGDDGAPIQLANSPLVTTCGHYLHYQCFVDFSTAAGRAGARTSSPNIMTERGDLQCPLCKNLGNFLLPTHPKQSATSTAMVVAPMNEDHLQSATLAVLTWSALRFAHESEPMLSHDFVSMDSSADEQDEQGEQNEQDVGVVDDSVAVVVGGLEHDAVIPVAAVGTDADAVGGGAAALHAPLGGGHGPPSGVDYPTILFSPTMFSPHNHRGSPFPLKSNAFGRAIALVADDGRGSCRENVQRARLALHATAAILRIQRDTAIVKLAGEADAHQTRMRREHVADQNISPWLDGDTPAPEGTFCDAIVCACVAASHSLIASDLNMRTINITSSDDSAASGGASASAEDEGKDEGNDKAAGVMLGLFSAARRALELADNEVRRRLALRTASPIWCANIVEWNDDYEKDVSIAPPTLLLMRDNDLFAHILLFALTVGDIDAETTTNLRISACLHMGLIARMLRCLLVEWRHVQIVHTEDPLSPFVRLWEILGPQRRVMAGACAVSETRVPMAAEALRKLVMHTCSPFFAVVARASKALGVPYAGADLDMLAGRIFACSELGALANRWSAVLLASVLHSKADTPAEPQPSSSHLLMMQVLHTEKDRDVWRDDGGLGGDGAGEFCVCVYVRSSSLMQRPFSP